MERGPGRGLGIWAVVLLVVGALGVLAPVVLTVALGQRPVDTRTMRSDHMDPTYRRGDRLFLAGADGGSAPVARGDVVLFSSSEWGPGDHVERVVALGGDRISYRRGDAALLLNGRPLAEPYLKDHRTPATVDFDVVVPEGRMFLMGDNRVNSADSSYRRSTGRDGTVALSAVTGKAVARPTTLIVLGGVGLCGVLVFLAGGGLGTAALLVRRRARGRRAVPVGPYGPVPGR
ncbi:signal peptidase I [Streptomyces antimicrobicus]|uniref:Signal peptidase I n=1 Tax=Streptomyces antimicrobicus TaxID=2883108 RepID=A0ABS8BEW4_9ACTN|nr:signal peptidase I [Streptomyces antimicrobicus]MCB5183161.1 signal peptidase I [Streptomyces antimicrobicus]